MAKVYFTKPLRGRGVSRTLCVSLLTALFANGALTAGELSTANHEQLPNINAQAKRTQLIGSVVDSKTGEPIIGANVIVKTDPTRGAATDIDGKFRLSVSPGETIVVSYLGYTSKEIKLGKQSVLEVTLSEDAAKLGEVVVTAFGTGQKKETVTGSIQTVRPSDLKVPATNLSTAFAGRLSGVVAYQRSGAPGSNGADFFVRGVSTMSGATRPLIILDDVQVSAADLNALDPEVIESFSVLKDATASAMYGTRGANGVLIIKTKSGADLERPVIGVRAEAFVNTPINVPKIANAQTFMRMYNEAVTNQGTGAKLYSQEFMDNVASGADPYLYPNVDWYKELFKTSTFNQRANFNVRGGTSKITYFMNLNASHETGMLRGRSKDYFSFDNNIDYMKYAFQNNVDFHLSKDAKIALHLNVSMNNFHGPITAATSGDVNNIFGSVLGVNAVDFPIAFPQDDTRWIRWGGVKIGSTPISNPMAVATAGYKDMFESTVVANLSYDQKLDFVLKGLSFKALASFKNWSSSSKFRYQGYNAYHATDVSQDPSSGEYRYTITSFDGNPTKPSLGTNGGTAGDRRYYLQAILNYNRAFGDHNVSGMLLANADEYNNNVNGTDLIASLPYRKLGFAFRATYDYAHKYLLEVNAGYNGSENFAPGRRWGFFPSISLGWNVSQEKFWEPFKKVVSNFKLRGSYGLVGNDQIGGARFVYMAIVNPSGSGNYITGYDGSTEQRNGPTFTRLQNNAITWEVGEKLNFGADIQLFNSLNIVADVFQEIRSDIFQRRQTIPNAFGTAATEIYGNFAKVKNWGFDFSVDYGKQISKDFSMQFRGTFTYARNRVLEYDEAPGLRPHLRQVGKSLNTHWGYIADGLYIDEADIAASPTSQINNIAVAPGDVKYLDQPDLEGKFDGKITTDDRVPLGYPIIPEIVYGFGPSMKWKNIDFSFFFQGQARVSLMMSNFVPFGSQERRNVLQWIADDYWSRDNQNIHARYPRLTQENNNHSMAASSFWLRNAAFLKLKNLEVGYNFKGARVYFSATNLLTLSSFKLWDPEMGGGSGMAYPLQRTFNIGLQLTFNRK